MEKKTQLQTASNRIVLLASPCTSTWVVYWRLKEEFPELEFVIEEPVLRSTLIRNRIRRLGIWTVLGQLVFMAGVLPFLRRLGRARSAEIKQTQGFRIDSAEHLATKVPSVNSREARRVLAGIDPKVVIVNGTRIIGAKTLEAVSAPFINMHAGITPNYRGVHGGYWAMFNREPQLAGTTVHFVDEGIDTGNVIAQERIDCSRADNFVTYPWLQLAAGLPALIKVAKTVTKGGNCHRFAATGADSRLYYHPTVWQYLWGWVRFGVK